MIQHLIYFFTLSYYRTPIVTKVSKKSIMGNITDKTIDYYTHSKLTSPLEEKFIIDYKIGNSQYSLFCTSETYDEALDYIKKSVAGTCNILAAFDGNRQNISDIVIRASGPEGNFYKDTVFEIRANDISDFPIVIITKDLEIYRIEDEDVIDISPKP